MKKSIFIFMLFLFLFSITVCAKEDNETFFDEKTLTDTVPEDVKKYIPDSLFEKEENGIYSPDVSSLAEFAEKYITDNLKNTLKTFSSFFSLILLCSVVNSFKNTLSNEENKKMISLVSLCVLALFSYQSLNGIWEIVENYIKNMNTFISSMLPVMTLFYSLGGNVATSVVNNAGMTFGLTLTSALCSKALFPAIRICYGMALASTFNINGQLSTISKTIKKCFTAILSLIITVCSLFLLFQTSVSSSADEFTARTVKLAGSFVPVIGSALGDSVKSVISSLNMVKNSTGFLGLIIIIVITLPVLIDLFMKKISLHIISFLSQLLGCKDENILINELISVIDFCTAICIVFSIMFIFSITLFIKTSLAMGGI